MTSYTAKHCIISLLILLTTSFHHVTAQSDDRTYGTYRISPSMAFIVAALVATLFFMAFFSIYIRNCYNTNDASIAANRTARSRRQAAARGLDASVIETFPTFVYSTVKGLKIGKGALECAVCLCEFEDEETLRLIPKCDHVFHPECIDMWLAAHITCPVCRANLSPNPDDPVSQPGELGQTEIDLEAQNNAAELEQERVSAGQADVQVVEPEALNMSRTRGSRSGRPRKFPRSHSTGHSVVQPGENIDRFTLKLPAEIRKQIMTRALERTVSMVVFPTEGSTRRGYRTSGEGSSRGKYKQLERLDQGTNSERFLGRNQSFLVRAKSFLTRVSSSVRSPRVTTNNGEGSSIQSIHIEGGR